MNAWLCACFFADGTGEVTQWLTQDGADQMASETEAEQRRLGRKCACVVVPEDAATEAQLQAVAVAEILIETDDEP
jgi:hypothetical protein